MRSPVHGKGTSKAEVLDITPNGVWVLVRGREYMLPFSKFPWFKGARVVDVLNLRLIRATHLYWPDLDIDLSVEMLEQPERFPLMDRVAKKREYRSPAK